MVAQRPQANSYERGKGKIMKASSTNRGTIVITASSFATSNPLGGHYRSAAAIADLLHKNYDVILLNPGTKPSPVMQVDGIETVFLKGSPECPGQLRIRIAALMRERKVRAVLAFDQKAGELMRPLARRMKVGLVLVKPGGGQPRLYYTKAKHNIVFMATDKIWLEKVNPKNSCVQQIAGRVYMPPQDLEAQAELRARIGLLEDEIAIVRIGRIEPHYGAVNRAAIALAARLRSLGIPARLVIIGTAESADEYAALSLLKAPQDQIVCDKRYTDRASKLLGMFRYSVGTGRGFMEAASMGHVMFCASQDPRHGLPLLVTEKNFQGFFNDNFSPRITPDIDEEANLMRILDLFQDPARQCELSTAARRWYEIHFSAETSRQNYIDVIENAVRNPECFSFDHVLSELHLRLSVVQDRLRQRLVFAI